MKKLIGILAMIAIIASLYPAQVGFAANEEGPWCCVVIPSVTTLK